MNKNAKMRVGLALPVALFMAANSWGEMVPYIDENGQEKEQECTKLSTVADITTLNGCYVVDENLSYTSQMRASGGKNVILILADGKTLTVNNSGDDAFSVGGSNLGNLTIYGQTNQTGSMKLSGKGGTWSSTLFQTGRGVHAKNMVINGGVITITSESSDGIYVSSNVTINGGVVNVSTSSSIHNGIKGDAISLSWMRLTDNIKASSYSGTVSVVSGKALKDESANKYEGTLTTAQKTAIKGKLLMPYAPVVFVGDSAIIDGKDSSGLAVEFPNPIDVSTIVYINRDLSVNIPATMVLPFKLPEGASVNAKFYRLRTVEQVGCAWSAKMKNIGSGVLPTENTPYMVVLQEGDNLNFNLGNGKASFRTQASETNEVSVQEGDWLFMGNYSLRHWSTSDSDIGLYYGLFGDGDKKGKFGKISTDSYAFPLRAYLKKANENVRLVCSSARPAACGESAIISDIPEIIDVELIDEDENGEHTTFVGRMNTRTGEIQMKRDYDLKGRKLNGTPTARGAYYGKKVIKK